MNQRISQLQLNQEQRVRFFLSVGPAVVTFFVAAPNIWPTHESSWPIARLTALVILLLYGIETLHSLNWLIVNIRENSKLAGAIRDQLSSTSPTFRQLEKIISDAEKLKERADKFRRTVRGSLPEFMYLSNSLLSGGILFQMWSLIAPIHAWTWICGGIVFLGTGWMQYRYSRWMRNIVPENWVRARDMPA